MENVNFSLNCKKIHKNNERKKCLLLWFLCVYSHCTDNVLPYHTKTLGLETMFDSSHTNTCTNVSSIQERRSSECVYKCHTIALCLTYTRTHKDRQKERALESIRIVSKLWNACCTPYDNSIRWNVSCVRKRANCIIRFFYLASCVATFSIVVLFTFPKYYLFIDNKWINFFFCINTQNEWDSIGSTNQRARRAR